MMFGMLPKVILTLPSLALNTGLKKKLRKAAKFKDCDVVGEWIKSITNHMYWRAASSPDGDGKKMEIFNEPPL